MGSDKNDIRTKLDVFKEYKNISLLAEKVESIEEYNEYRKLGFLYFQGYFFSKPQVIECKKLDPTRGAILELCSLLDRDVDIKTLEEKFMKYPELTINLLRYLNSAFFGMKKDISSIRHALNMLGRSMLKKWLILFLYAGANENRFSEPLVRMAMSRAKTMTLLVEKIIKNAKDEQKDMGFMVGMLSLLDAFLNSSLQDIISGVELNAEIKNALLNKSGILGELLMFVKAFEATDFELVEKKLNDFKITYYEWMEILKESNEWVTKNLP